MTDVPRDDQPRDDEPHDESGDAGNQGPIDPFAALFSQLSGGQFPGGQFSGGQVPGGGNIDLTALIAQVQQMLGSSAGFAGPAGGAPTAAGGSGVDWAQARTATRHLSATKGSDPTPTAADQRALADAARLAEHWLDAGCEFAAVPSTPQVWSRADWIENTLDSWRPIVEPIVTSLGTAMTAMLTPETDEDDPMAGLATMFAPMLRQMAAGMYTMQFSQAVAELSTDVVSGAEIGFQLLAQPRVTLLQSNIDTQFADLDVNRDDLRLYLTLRESARQRLYGSVGWLAPQLLALVEHYARETKIDREAIEASIEFDELQSMSPETLQKLSQDLQGKLFEPTQTDEQKGVLERLETLLALTEGWVDHVVARVAAVWMPNHEALAEVVRRRRGAGGPAEKVFATLVGLELRPRRIRDAQNLWAAIDSGRGSVARDGVWAHPDLLPTSSDLDDPLGFAASELDGTGEPMVGEPDDLDRELAKLLEQERGSQD